MRLLLLGASYSTLSEIYMRACLPLPLFGLMHGKKVVHKKDNFRIFELPRVQKGDKY